MVKTELQKVVNKGEELVATTPEYDVFKLSDGKFERRMKYEKKWSRIPETQDEMLELFQVLNESENEKVTELKKAVGEILTIKHIFFNPYSSFNEETGDSSNGVNSTIETLDGEFYATSSKTVFWNLKQMFEVFGFPSDEAYSPIKVAVTSTKQSRGDQLGLKVLGFADI